MKLLINSVNEFRQVVSLNSDMTFRNLQPALVLAQAFVAKFTGPALIVALLEAQENPSPAQEGLLALIRIPIGNLAALKYATTSNVNITDLGVLRNAAGEQKDAFEWQVQQTLQGLSQNAWDGLESLLVYLEANIGDFPEYADSVPYGRSRKSLIRSAEVFSQALFIGDSRLTFWTLQSCLQAAEKKYIRPRLGDRYATFLEETGLDDEQRDQLDTIRRALAYATIARALRERLVNVTDKGVQVNLITNVVQQQRPPTEQQLQTAIAYYEGEADSALNEVAGLLPSESPSTGTGGLRGDRIVSF